ncbi:TetR family transcriptional regulator [Streptomyces sp. MNU76]|nr:TetR family transcriptional regulator [Streptomyces sp. MNU76]
MGDRGGHGLFATQPPDEVTVADIAARAEMTSAAV